MEQIVFKLILLRFSYGIFIYTASFKQEKMESKFVPKLAYAEEQDKEKGLAQNKRGTPHYLINTPWVGELKEIEDYREKMMTPRKIIMMKTLEMEWTFGKCIKF